MKWTSNYISVTNKFKIYISATTTEPTSIRIKFVHEHICSQNFKWSNDICTNNFFHDKLAFEFNSSTIMSLCTILYPATTPEPTTSAMTSLHLNSTHSHSCLDIISFPASTPEPTTSTMTSLHLNSTRPNHESRHNFIYSNHTRTSNFCHDKFAFEFNSSKSWV
jgi:hypothetical protein